jgi:hypothetical protein
MIEVTDWDEDYERLVRLLDSMPPTLLTGLLCHVTKACYGRGVFGTYRMAKGQDYRTTINGQVSGVVKNVERQLKEGREPGVCGGRPIEPTVFTNGVTSRSTLYP